MAKLADLKTLLGQAPRRKVVPSRLARSEGRGVDAAPGAVLEQAFADVTPLAPSNRARLAKAKPLPRPAQRLADEAAALTSSKFGNEPSPTHWDIGQEQESN